jgi:alpha-mannosidase
VHRFEKTCVGLAAGYLKPGEIAWFATHHHSPKGNQAYQFSYLFHLKVPVIKGEENVILPMDFRLKIFAVSAVRRPAATVTPAAPLHDDPVRYGSLVFSPALVHKAPL